MALQWLTVELATRLFLVHRSPISGAGPQARSTWQRSLERLASRKPVAVIGPLKDAEFEECASYLGCSARVASDLEPPGSDPVDHDRALLRALDELAREFPAAEVVVLLGGAEIQTALSCALIAPERAVFAPEPGQTIALDWPHPDAREFKHGLVGIGFDWDVGPVAKQVLRFPGGASVLPRS